MTDVSKCKFDGLSKVCVEKVAEGHRGTMCFS